MDDLNQAALDYLSSKEWVVFAANGMPYKIVDPLQGYSPDNLEPIVLEPGAHIVEDKVEIFVSSEVLPHPTLVTFYSLIFTPVQDAR